MIVCGKERDGNIFYVFVRESFTERKQTVCHTERELNVERVCVRETTTERIKTECKRERQLKVKREKEGEREKKDKE